MPAKACSRLPAGHGGSITIILDVPGMSGIGCERRAAMTRILWFLTSAVGLAVIAISLRRPAGQNREPAADPPLRPNEDRENARAEYSVVSQLNHGTSVMRFGAMAAFFAYNAVILSAFTKDSIYGTWTWIVLACALVGNFLFTLLEWRSTNAHSRQFERGRELEHIMGIRNGIMSASLERRGLPFGHGVVLNATYCLTSLAWLVALVCAICS